MKTSRRTWTILEVIDEATQLLGEQIAHRRALDVMHDARDCAPLVSAAVAVAKDQREAVEQAKGGRGVNDEQAFRLLLQELLREPAMFARLKAEIDARSQVS